AACRIRFSRRSKPGDASPSTLTTPRMPLKKSGRSWPPAAERIDRFYGSYSASAVQVGEDVPSGPVGVTYSPELTVDDYPVLRSEIPAGENGIDALQRLGKIRLATARDVAAWSGDKGQQSKLASDVGTGPAYLQR